MKAKKPKPFKGKRMWAVVDEDGELVTTYGSGAGWTYRTKALANRIVKVTHARLHIQRVRIVPEGKL